MPQQKRLKVKALGFLKELAESGINLMSDEIADNIKKGWEEVI